MVVVMLSPKTLFICHRNERELCTETTNYAQLQFSLHLSFVVTYRLENRVGVCLGWPDPLHEQLNIFVAGKE